MAITELENAPIETPVAQRPLVRELAEWRTLIPFAGRVAALQGTHPTIAKGLYDHSTAFTDPVGRTRRTLEYAERMLFGMNRAETAAEIRSMHRDIKGTGLDGRPYHAWNRDAWTWVHLSTFDAFRYSLKAVHGAIPLERMEALYAVWREAGELYGVRPQDMPGDVASLRAYIRNGVETKLSHSPDPNLIRDMARPKEVPLPDPVWALLRRVSRHPLEVVLYGPWPSLLRRRVGITWTPVHTAEYRAFLGVLRTVPAVLPDRLRMLPYAHRALHAPAA